MKEYLFGIDEYNKPLSVKDKDALSIKLLRLLLMEPGEDPLHPEMGVGVVEKYRYCLEDDIADLESDISLQLSTYLPEYTNTAIECSLVDKYIVIEITIDDTMFRYSTDQSDQSAISLLKNE